MSTTEDDYEARDLGDSDEQFASGDAFQNIKNLIDKMKTTALDYNNFETEYRSLYTANQFLSHNLQTLFTELVRHEKEEEVILNSLEKGGIIKDDVSSEAWKPLADIRGKMKLTLINIKDLLVLQNTCNFMAVGKFKVLIDVNKGLILHKEMSKNQFAIAEQSDRKQTRFMEIQLKASNDNQSRLADLFERSLGTIVATIGDISSERIKELKEKHSNLKREVLQKEKELLDVAKIKKENNLKVESLEEELAVLKSTEHEDDALQKETELSGAARDAEKSDSVVESVERDITRLRSKMAYPEGVLDKRGSTERNQQKQPEIAEQAEACANRLHNNIPPNNNTPSVVSDDEVNKFKTVARRILDRCGKPEAFQNAYKRYENHANGRQIMLDALEEVAKPIREEKGFDD